MSQVHQNLTYAELVSTPGPCLATQIQRLLAAIIDVALFVVAILPGGLMIELVDHGPPSDNPLVFIAMGIMAWGLVILVIPQLYLLITRSQSIGKYVMKIQIWDLAARCRADFLRTFVLRGLVIGMIGSIPIFGWIFTLVDICFIFRSDARCIHDLIAGTIVVKLNSYQMTR